MALYGLIWLEIALADYTSLRGAHPRRSARGSSNCWKPVPASGAASGHAGSTVARAGDATIPCPWGDTKVCVPGAGCRGMESVTSCGCRPWSAAPRSRRL